MDFKKRIIEELEMTDIQADTLDKGYVQVVEKLAKEYYAEQLILHGVGNWLRFEDKKPVIGQRYLLVWETYPPEIRIWQKEDVDKNWDTLRWLPIPEWK